jgi:hypothetical protein
MKWDIETYNNITRLMTYDTRFKLQHPSRTTVFVLLHLISMSYLLRYSLLRKDSNMYSQNLSKRRFQIRTDFGSGFACSPITIQTSLRAELAF